MVALDFMLACVGIGALVVSLAWAYQLVNDAVIRSREARTRRSRGERPRAPRFDVPAGSPLENQLKQIQQAQFGKPMLPHERPVAPAPAETWPVLKRRTRPSPAPKNEEKE